MRHSFIPEFPFKLIPSSIWMVLLGVCLSCKTEKSHEIPVFSKLSSSKTNIEFENTLTESDTFNYFLFSYMYMGGGVTVGDFNTDGLTDIYFTGNMTGNRMYLNMGDLEFKDVTAISGTAGNHQWMLGSTLCDINEDGLPDIYVSVSGLKENCRNLLFINQGNNSEGIPLFKEEAGKYGIDDNGKSTQTTFFDYDNDDDLDLYVANYPITQFKSPPFFYRQMMNNAKIIESSHLYRNNGNGTYTDVTAEAGLLTFGLALSATVSDLNMDGYKDLFISNDFTSPDFYFINNGNGTFTDRLREVTGQTSFYGMGADIADYNNDGLHDILQIDMAPEDNKRAKENMTSMRYDDFMEMINEGLHYQYRYSTLQLNRGMDEKGLPVFSNAAWLAGMTSTDWSWAGLFADFNLDGWKDIFITNGIRRDINNLDFFDKLSVYEQSKGVLTNEELFKMVDEMPYQKLVNYLYKNNGDLTFTKSSSDWGIKEKNYSNGTAYADLDNDGDLELIINNIDEKATVYKNNSRENNSGNYLKTEFKGFPHNTFGIGSIVHIWHGGKLQMAELTLSRGYESSMEPCLNFGTGKDPLIDSLVVTWPDGKTQKLINLPVNQRITLAYENAMEEVQEGNPEKLFSDITTEIGIDFVHKENPFSDYDKQVLLPHKLSSEGPKMATGDINKDGMTDLFIGNALNSPAAMYLQKNDGTFIIMHGPWEIDKDYEDTGTILFDADNDEDLDLYVVSGGNEFKEASQKYNDRLYINDGKGNFTKATDVLPDIKVSGSCIESFDYDNDGDLDLFRGGRHVPGKYPFPAGSTILKNNSAKGIVKFEDVTANVAPELLNAGMVTSAFCADIDGNKTIELIVAGEWMPICIYKNENGKFRKTALPGTNGWWFSLEGADMDKDGDIDIVCGNLGLNMRYKASAENTFDIYSNDFDKDGTTDIALCFYQNNKQYPVRSRSCYLNQNPGLVNRFPTYTSFAEATIQEVYTKEVLDNSLHLKAEIFSSCYLENDGHGNYRIMALPNEAQLSAINDIILDDFDQDGNLDILSAGNLYDIEIVTPRNDAGVGLFLRGNGKGSFEPVSPAISGFFARGDVKSLTLIPLGRKAIQNIIVCGINNNTIKTYLVKDPLKP